MKLRMFFSAGLLAAFMVCSLQPAVAKVSTTTAVTVSTSTYVYGPAQAETFTVTVTGASGSGEPSGTVTVSGNHGLGTLATITLGSSCTTVNAFTLTCTGNGTIPANTATNTITITATYGGSSTYATSSGTATVTITKATPTFGTMSFSPAATEPYGANQAITISDTLTYSGAAPTGAVTYVMNGVTYTATCSGASPETCSATVPAATIAALTVAGSPYTVTAASAADGNYKAATGTSGTFTITKDAPTATMSAASAAYGGTVTLSATDDAGSGAAPTGAATFTVNGTTAPGTPTCTTSGSTETCTLSYTLPPALTGNTTYNMKAAFAADANHKAATSATVKLTVTRATSTAAISSVTGYYQQKVDLSMSNTGIGSAYAAPTGAPSITVGTVTQQAKKVCSASSDVNSCTTTYNIRAAQPQGTYTITVKFAQDDNYAQSTGTGTLTVTLDSSTTTVTANPSNLQPSGSTTLTATVANASHSSDVPSGTVTFTEGSVNFGSCTLSGGTCSLTVQGSSLPAGREDTITGSYGGATGEIAASSGTVTLTVPADIVFSSVTHDFGTVPVNSAATYGVHMTNNDATAFPVSLTLSGPSTFTQANTCGSSLAASSSCEIVFTYTPTGANGIETATWSVANPNNLIFNPSDGGTLTAQGVASAGVTVTTSAHDFGDQDVGTSSDVYGVVLTNGTSTAAQVAVGAGTDTTDFVISGNNCPATLQAYASCNLQFYFDPQSAGFLEDFVSLSVTQGGNAVTVTDGSGQTVTGITLDGTGQ